MRFKKTMSLVLAATMVTGSSFMAFAAGDDADANSGRVSGTGAVEGIISSEVWNVVLPTETAGETTYNFILDPQGLIAKTQNGHYANGEFESGANLYFKSATQANGKDNYTKTSDAKKITNKSTMDVDVTLMATVTPGEGVTMSSDKTFADDTSASVYLALIDGETTRQEVAVGSDNTATMTATIDKAPDGAYKVAWNNSENKYEYVLDSTATPTFDEFEFSLTGACNANGDWTGLEDAAPSVEVVWAVAPHKDNVLASDGTNAIVIYYTGDAPTVLTVSKTGAEDVDFAIPSEHAVLDAEEKKVSMPASSIELMKSMASTGYGAGSYVFQIKGIRYNVTVN